MGTNNIRAADVDRSFEDFFLRLLDYFGVYVEELDYRTYLFRPDLLLTDEFPSLPSDGLWVTFDRARALNREDIDFITWDHPFVLSVMELFLDGEHGNASFALWETPREDGLFLEVVVVVECVASPALHVDRFLPPKPIRIVVDHTMSDATNNPKLAAAQLKNSDLLLFLDQERMTDPLLPQMLDKALDVATEEMHKIVNNATRMMTIQLNQEIERLEDLYQINNHVTLDEITQAKKHKSDLRTAIETARLRISGLRLIQQRLREEE